jgi:hypothetical protein
MLSAFCALTPRLIFLPNRETLRAKEKSMKYLNTLWLAVAVSALLAISAASAASATELYSGETTLPTGTEFHVHLASGTSATQTTTDGKTMVLTCPQTTGKGASTNQSGASVSISISSLVASGCTVTTHTLTNGTVTITHIPGTDDGTVTASGSVQTINFGGISCRYGTGAGTHLGTLNTGKIAIKAVINEQDPKSFICPDTTLWVTAYAVTTPVDLNVTAN